MAKHRLFFLYCYGFLLVAFQVRGKHAATIQAYETDGEGTVLFNETGHTNCTVTSLSPAQTWTYVTFDEHNSLVIQRPLDLEVLNLQGNTTTLTVNYKCDGVQQNARLHVLPVNEFNPIFKGSPYTRIIAEGTAEGTEVIYLGNKWSDEDKVKYGVASIFRLHPYTITAFDGKQHFKMDNVTGNLTTTTVFDYENLRWRNYFMLNVSVEDDGGRASYTTVNVTIQDIDDNPPKFTCKVTSDQCYITAYTAETHRFFQGSLEVSPELILAKDIDTGINDKILYTIDSEDKFATNLQINNYTGAVEVIVPFANLTNWTDAEIVNISLQVTATEDSENSHHTNISLTVLVYRELPTTTSLPTTTTTPAKSSTSTTTVHKSEQPSQIDYILIVEIVVPVCAAVVIAIIFVCVIRNCKKKQRDTRYKLGESQKQENLRKSESFDHENIDVISSTPINPYELISMYARMGSNKNSQESSPKSSKTEDKAPSGKGESHDDIYDNATISASEREVNNGDLYTKVDKRKPRRRQKQALAFAIDAVETAEETEHAMESETSEPDPGVGQFNNISETNRGNFDNSREITDTSMMKDDMEADRYYINIEEVNEDSKESPCLSKLTPGGYSTYDDADAF
ncbi:protocadherin Fat 2-like [Mercenaria mercenaria]|uniref:protocadherin Fat 2-like n=1 Tax=Mercenaria mercenaria TaxID=6596 RepID=UPI00234F3734|nr:protocadherin Fat 2-like [Mercenaria mercenaria]